MEAPGSSQRNFLHLLLHASGTGCAWVGGMKSPKKSAAPPKLSSSDVLDALGLERRHSKSRDVAVAVGLAAAGAVVGAGAVLLRAGVVSLSTPKAAGKKR